MSIDPLQILSLLFPAATLAVALFCLRQLRRRNSDAGFRQLEQGLERLGEVVHTLRTGLIRAPRDEKYTNARFIVQ